MNQKNEISCANEFCVYWNAGTCIRGGISLDVQGCCRECLYVSIPESELKKAREQFLCGSTGNSEER